jgi:hypothetical protein
MIISLAAPSILPLRSLADEICDNDSLTVRAVRMRDHCLQ